MSLPDKEYQSPLAPEKSVFFDATNGLSDAGAGEKRSLGPESTDARMRNEPAHAEETDARGWIARGQAEELAGRYEVAIHAYDRAIACHASQRSALQFETVYDLAVAWMNRGNALQKLPNPTALEESERSYQQTIELLCVLKTLDENQRRTLGCAWMNQGGVRQKLGRPADAVAAFDSAIEVLSALPISEDDGHSQNMLAAAWMNRGSAVLQVGDAVDIDAAQLTAQKALSFVVARETTDPTALEVALKARCILCEIFGAKMHNGGANSASIAAEASDVAEEALALLRAWAQKTGNLPHAPLTVWFFQFGSACYADFQPHFLAAFLEENLDAAAEPAFSAVAVDFRRVAQASIAATRTRLHSLLFAEPASPEAERWLAALRSFETLAARPDVVV